MSFSRSVVSDTAFRKRGGGALGHPRVWLNTGREGVVDCPYCDRQYVLKPGLDSRRRSWG